ncbi:hypothetical protein L1049_006301 [Liquidambar formosana]|uniref:CLAVATA3/ESR (CLE)-related protein 27 n=1 Tax=Liquidambar formosana TaxID=63359 RepID=A0AAP0RF97_LIQFO
MSYSGGRRIVYPSLVVLLMISVLQIWVCCDCQAGAIRIFPGNSVAKGREVVQDMKDKKSKEELFHKYFNGRAFDFNTSGNGFEESKRRVPSCPDPLHNK